MPVLKKSIKTCCIQETLNLLTYADTAPISKKSQKGIRRWATEEDLSKELQEEGTDITHHMDIAAESALGPMH